MPKSSTQLRALWKDFECAESSMVLVPFGPDRIRVAPPTVPAWEALAAVMQHHRYEIRTTDTDSYNCRQITGGTGRSLHAFGIALDVNWTTNPYIDHAGKRPARFSDEATQALRALDVRHGRADTDMTAEMIADVARIRTKGGVAVFEWGGSWRDRKDCMHFELDVGPTELADGIDVATVAGWDALGDAATGGVAAVPAVGAELPAVAAGSEPHVVIARSGLRLRSGASREADIIRTLPAGTRVFVLDRRGEWALVDLEGDGQADGFVGLDFLRPTAGVPEDVRLVPAAPAMGMGVVGSDITGLIGVDMIAAMCPVTPKASIAANLPFVLDGLRARALGDRPMVLMALATIRAETEGFVPISEGQSRFNTRASPFDLYEPGTRIGRRLGNVHAGDGARFKGRGYVQLTGRFNYTRIGGQIGVDLAGQPDRANDPPAAGLILAQFLKNQEAAIRRALAADELRTARKLVNGGVHGFERFADAYARGLRSLPA